MELFPPLHVQERVDLLSRIQSKAALLKKKQRLIAPDEEREQEFDDKKTDIQRIFTKYKYKGNDTNLHRKINAKI